MADETETPFDTIESAHQYVGLLKEVLKETQNAIQRDIALPAASGAQQRRFDAIQLVNYKLDRLSFHLGVSRRILNDLRMLRRLLLDERGGDREMPVADSPAPPQRLEVEESDVSRTTGPSQHQ